MEEVKKKIEKLMFEQQNNSNNQVGYVEILNYFSIVLRFSFLV